MGNSQVSSNQQSDPSQQIQAQSNEQQELPTSFQDQQIPTSFQQQQIPTSFQQQLPQQLQQQQMPQRQQYPNSFSFQGLQQQQRPQQQQYSSSFPFQAQSQVVSPEFINLESPAYQQRVQKREKIKQNMAITKKAPVIQKTELDPEEKKLGLYLVEKASTENPQFLYSLLKDGVNPNISNENGDYAVHMIMKRVDFKLEFLKKFFDEEFKNEVDINVKNKEGQTILHLACKMEDPEVSQYLLEKGADPNIQDKDGNTCLHLLATKTNTNRSEIMLQQCLDYGGNIEISNNSNQNCNQMTTNTNYQRLFVEQKLNFNEDVFGGDVEVALSWNNLNDLDLHCYCKCGKHIYYSEKQCFGCHGYLDFDMNVSPSNTNPRHTSKTPVEHIYWPHVVPGVYTISVVFFSWHNGYAPLETDFLVVMKVKDEGVFEKSFRLEKVKGEVIVLKFEFDKNGKWIEKK